MFILQTVQKFKETTADALIESCKGTIPLRPNNDIGLAYERSLTIWFVESGLEKLAAGHGAMPGHGFRGMHVEIRSWAWTFKP